MSRAQVNLGPSWHDENDLAVLHFVFDSTISGVSGEPMYRSGDVMLPVEVVQYLTEILQSWRILPKHASSVDEGPKGGAGMRIDLGGVV